MTLPLGLTDVGLALFILWWVGGLGLGLVIAAVTQAFAKSNGRPLARPMLFAASQCVTWGSYATICGIAQRAYNLGLFSWGLWNFMMFMATLAVISSIGIGRFGGQARA